MRYRKGSLYAKCRELLKNLFAVVAMVVGVKSFSGCLGRGEPKFKYGFEVVGSEEDKRIVGVLMSYLEHEVHSGKWRACLH
jgi:hypothetical protein